MAKWYQKSFRRNLVDMHIEDWDETFLRAFDPAAYFDCLRRAHIQSPMIYLQSHVGLCNWDTASGRTHRAFIGDNKIKTLIDLCHGANMDVIAYYSLIYNNWAYDVHPDWRMVDEHGHPSRARESLGRYGLVCPNNPDYRAFIKAQFEEFCSVYDFEGIFFDMDFWPMVCYCEHCCDRYWREEGAEMPTTVDWQDARFSAFQAARQRWMADFVRFATEEIKRLKPDVDVEHQFAGICSPWVRGLTEANGEYSDYVGGDLYGGYLEESYICKLYREASKNQPFEYMTSRCDPFLNVHTTTKSVHELMLHNALSLAHHGAFLVIDAIDPVGTLNPAVYDRLGEVFRFSAGFEPYLTGRYVADVALLMSYQSKMNLFAAPETAASADTSSNPQLRAQLGAAQILLDAHIPFTVLPSNKLARLNSMRFVLLTDACRLLENEIDALEAYVRQGGSLYLSGTTDERLSQRLFGLRRHGVTVKGNTYIAPTARGQSCFGDEFSVQYPLAHMGAQVLCQEEVPGTCDILATVTLPYTNPADRTKFASIHSNPPGIATEYPAIAFRKVGKGKALWVAAPIELNKQESHKRIVQSLWSMLYGTPPLETDAPISVEMTLFDDTHSSALYLNIINKCAEEGLFVRPFNVSLHLKHQITQVTRVSDGTTISFTQRESKVTLQLEAPEIFDVFRLQVQS